MHPAPIHLLDVTGLLCPVPVLMTAHAAAQLAIGEILEVTGDDREMLVDLPAWCDRTGNLLLEISERDGRIRCRIERALLARID